MRRRKKSSEGSLDSLLDTMTNVVGILVIVLVVTQMGVGEAVKRIVARVPKVTPEALDAAKDESEELRKLVEKAQSDAKANPNEQLTLTQVQKLKADLEREIKNLPMSDIKVDDARKIVQDRTKQKKELEDKIRKAEEELARIKAQLDQTKIVEAPPPKIIKLPNPRSAPKGIQPALFICREGRIIYLDLEAHKTKARAIVERAVRELYIGRTPAEVDCDRLVAYFDKRFYGDRDVQYRLRVINFELYLLLERRKDAGEPTERIVKNNSRLLQNVRKINPKTHYARFHVWADSFDTYIEARKVTDQRNLLAGWHPQTTKEEHRLHLGMKVKCKGKPPPPPPKPKPPQPQPPQPPKPPVPTDDID